MIPCRLPTEEKREKLEIDMTQPALVLWRWAYDQDNRVLGLTHPIAIGNWQELVYSTI
jgi:GntR family transcriptional regulator